MKSFTHFSNSNQLEAARNHLELLLGSSGATATKKNNLLTHVGQVLSTWVDGLTRGQEPRVWQETSTAGESAWKAYDPLSERMHHFATEDALRSWLEQRYYQ